MAYEDIRVPKEKFLIDYFSAPKPAASVKPEKAFDEVLMSDPSRKAEAEIDNMNSHDAFIALKESINILKDIVGS